ncbi:acyl carrier protein [Streptomyces sp. CA-249302]|uniref:acyl carrier protein n=1 Tax=Streptomyces sp. CA-249302 TaxID=3240058 RepID=UPI003D934CB5
MTRIKEGVADPGGVRAMIRDSLGELLGCRPMDVDMELRLTEMPGMDSLRLVEAIVTVERTWQVTLDEDELFDVRTGNDLCALIESTIAARGGG